MSFAVQGGKRDEIGRVHGNASKRRRKELVYALMGEKITAAKILWCVIVLLLQIYMMTTMCVKDQDMDGMKLT